MSKKYLFRGSTINWLGNPQHRRMPCTPVTTNPIKAVLFAINCSLNNNYRYNRVPRVIYINKRSKLKGINTSKNWFAKVEDEIGYEIKPLDYISLCEGYIFLNDAIKIILNMGFTIPLLLEGLFDDALKNAPLMTDGDIEQFYLLVQPFLKKT